jgi:hypothetical protein
MWLVLIAASLLLHPAAAIKISLIPGRSECVHESFGFEHFQVILSMGDVYIQ